jgi:hypothetical protein
MANSADAGTCHTANATPCPIYLAPQCRKRVPTSDRLDLRTAPARTRVGARSLGSRSDPVPLGDIGAGIGRDLPRVVIRPIDLLPGW